MGVDLNPGITPAIGGANAAQPVDAGGHVLDPSQSEPTAEAPGSTVPGVWSQLAQLMATTGLQGTTAVDGPEIAAEQHSGQAGAGQATEAKSGLLAQQSLGNLGAAALTRDQQAAVADAARDQNLASRIQVSAAELSLPTAAAAAQVGTLAHDAVAPRTLEPGVLSSLVNGQSQPMWPLGQGTDEPRVRRRQARDPHSQSGHDDDDTLFEDDVPEQRVRERDAHAHTSGHDDEAQRGGDWCAALARRLARLQTRDAQGESPAAGAAALSLALAQWTQGRAVLIVCPQRAPIDETGWACLVWGANTNDNTAHHAQAVPTLRGQRFVARLHWKNDALDDPTASAARWWAVRTAKQHGVALGRQLRTMNERAQDARQNARRDAESPTGQHSALHTQGLAVQLGPVLLPQAREWALRVRIDAVQRLWAALDGQWSLLVIGCDEPLLPL